METNKKDQYFIKRAIEKTALLEAKKLKKWAILMLHWDSGAWKTHILGNIHKQIEKWSIYFVEDFTRISEKHFGFLELMIGKGLFDYDTKIKEALLKHIHITMNMNANHGTINQSKQEVTINTWSLSSQEVIQKMYGACERFPDEYVYFDAIEGIVEGEDREVFSQIIKRLQHRWVKIIMTSRLEKHPFNDMLELKVEKFNQEEAKDFIHWTFTTFSQAHQEILLKLVRYFDKINQERFDPIMLTLLYTLYYVNQEDLATMIDELKDSDQSVFLFGNESVWRKEFHHEVKKLIIKKIFREDPDLQEYFKKYFLLKYHQAGAEYLQADPKSEVIQASSPPENWIIGYFKNIFRTQSKHIINLPKPQSSFGSQWQAFEKFASINGRVMKNPHTNNLQWTLHDSLYHLIAKYFLSELSHHPTEYEEASKQYYRILEYWKGHRLEMNVDIKYILSVCDACQPAWARSTTPTAFAQFMMVLGIEFYTFWYYKEAIKFYQQCLNIREKLLLDDQSNSALANDLAKVYMNLGVAYRSTWKYQDAITFYLKASDIIEKLLLDDQSNSALKNNLAKVYGNLGSAYLSTWKYQDAITYHQKASDTIEKLLLDDQSNSALNNDLARVYVNLGNALDSTWKSQDAITFYQKASDIREKLLLDDQSNSALNNDLARVYMNLGVALDSTWKYQDAITFYLKASDIFEKLILNDQSNSALNNDLATVYMNLGSAYLSTWKYQDAITFYQKASDIIDKLLLDDQSNSALNNDLATVKFNMWITYSTLWDTKKALQNFEEAKSVWKHWWEMNQIVYTKII